MNESSWREIFKDVEYMGFKFCCIKCGNHYATNEKYAELHALKEHDIKEQKTYNWSVYFTTFGIGDYLSPSYRCTLDGFEFLREEEAKNHLVKYHGIDIKK